MNVKALALFSGGLDSMLAAKVVSDQGIAVHGITFETPFFTADRARRSAAAIGIPLTVVDLTIEHLAMLKNPRYGFGRNMNPCIDCHTLMIRKTGELLAPLQADFVITGEVLGQRPMSQGKQSLYIVGKNSGWADVLVRPLSAKLLPETRPEREGLLRREGLLDISGRGRKKQLELARHYGIADFPPPAGGCLLTDAMFTRRLRDLFARIPDPERHSLELLKYGRHFAAPSGDRILVGRNAAENAALQRWCKDGDWRLHLQSLPGPMVLVPNPDQDDTLLLAARLCALYGGVPQDQEVQVLCEGPGMSRILLAQPLCRMDAAAMIL